MSKISKKRYGFIDLETTGLVPGYHEVIEIGLIITDERFNEITRFDEKVKPLHIDRASDKAMEINGYDAEEWKYSLHPVAAVEALLKHKHAFVPTLEAFSLVGHNITFDMTHLTMMFFNAGISIRKFQPRYTFDTASMAHALKYKKLSGDYLLEKLGYEREQDVHRAINGAEKAMRIYMGLNDIEFSTIKNKNQIDMFAEETV